MGLKPYCTEIKPGEGWFTNAGLLGQWMQKTQHRPTATEEDGLKVLDMLGLATDGVCPLERADELESCVRLLPEESNADLAKLAASRACVVS